MPKISDMARIVGTRTQNVGGSALARECGLNPATVSRQLARGLSPDDVRRYAAIKRGVDPGPDPGMPADAPRVLMPSSQTELDMIAESRSKYNQLEDAKLRRAKALAERQEIENMVRRGELQPVHYIEKWLTRYLIDGRDELLRLSSELADELAGESDPVKVRAILTAAHERVIAKFDQVRKLWEPGNEETKVA